MYEIKVCKKEHSTANEEWKRKSPKLIQTRIWKENDRRRISIPVYTFWGIFYSWKTFKSASCFISPQFKGTVKGREQYRNTTPTLTANQKVKVDWKKMSCSYSVSACWCKYNTYFFFSWNSKSAPPLTPKFRSEHVTLKTRLNKIVHWSCQIFK